MSSVKFASPESPKLRADELQVTLHKPLTTLELVKTTGLPVKYLLISYFLSRKVCA